MQRYLDRERAEGRMPDGNIHVIDIWKVGGCLYDHNLRKQNGYYMQHVSTNCRKFTIRYTGRMFWNIVLQPVVHCAIVPTTAATMLLLFSKVEIIEASCVVVDVGCFPF